MQVTMKPVHTFCTSQASTSISTAMDSGNLHQPSSSTSVTGAGAGRAIDRHNPIIQDDKRLSRTHLPPPSSTTKKKSPKPAAKNSEQKRKSIAFSDENNYQESLKNKNTSTVSSSVVRRQGGVLLGWGCTRPSDFISPATSSRYLLNDKALSDQFDPLLEIVPSPAPAPAEKEFKSGDEKALKKKDDSRVLSSPAKPPSPSSSLSSLSSEPQVVVLRVSLHCKGCERKMRKHISKMEGVTSFNIDFMAKKVTVVGNVTPLAVLTSVSKVKNAKLLTPTTISSSSISSVNSDFSEIKKQFGLVT